MGNVPNRTIFVHDNLPVLRGMDSASVDLIYLDPPFNSGQDWAAPIGSEAAGAAFKDAWTLNDIDEAWVEEIEAESPALHHTIVAAGFTHGHSMQSYLTFMAIRLLEMQRVLKPTGSIYLHCDPTASHYLKGVMDAVFGAAQFRNEITWKRTSSRSDAKRFGRIHDVLLFYANGDKSMWNGAWEALDPKYVAKRYANEDSRGRWQSDQLTATGLRNGDSGQPWRGIDPAERGNHWRAPGTLPDSARSRLPDGYAALLTREKLDVLDEIGMIHWPAKEGGMPRFKRYLSTSKGRAAGDVITDIPPIGAHARERVGYPTQKPLALLERVIEASSDPGDIVLDPFCGCATACVAAEKLERQWIGIDISSRAHELVLQRLAREVQVGSEAAPRLTGWTVERRDEPPVRSDSGVRRSRDIKQQLYGRQAGNCNGCGEHFQLRNLTIDHMIPGSRGGPDVDENLQLLCGACNSLKGNRPQAALIAALRRQGIGA